MVWEEIEQGRGAKVVFFDIGQGDAVFLRTRQGHRLLVDGGPDKTLESKLFKELPFWSRRIDAVIATHPHQDHIAGLLPILESFDVASIIWTGVKYDSSVARAWEEKIKERKNDVTIAVFSTRVVMGRDILDILHPSESLEGQVPSNVDNTSLVARANLLGTKFLFTGDMFKDKEQELVSRGFDLTADILHVGHHGSRTSTDPVFVRAVSPAVAVIQSGEGNKFGHPHQETIATLQRYGITILRTDLEGDVVFRIKR